MNPAVPAPIELISRGVCFSDGYVLACRNRRRGNLYLPGGHIERGESARQALAREWREELGVDCIVDSFLAVHEQRFTSPDEGDTCELTLLFRCTSPTLRAPLAPTAAESHIAFEWIPLDGLMTAGLLPLGMARQLPAWLANPAPPVPSDWAEGYS